MFQLDGTITGNKPSGGFSIELGSIDRDHLVQVQRILLNFGVFTRIYQSKRVGGLTPMPDGHGGMKDYFQKASWSLRATTRSDRERLHPLVDWSTGHEERWRELCGRSGTKAAYRSHRFRATVLTIEPDGVEDVFDVTVGSGHSVIFNGIATGNCSEILQVSEPTTFRADGAIDHLGKDISCNLGSLNIAHTMDSPDFAKTVETAIRALTAVSDLSDIAIVPAIASGNRRSHAIGLGQMNLAGYLGREHIHYGSPVGLDFTNMYFYTVAYHAYRASNKIAKERGQTFDGFEASAYATGAYFDKYIDREWVPATKKVAALFESSDIRIPTQEDWKKLRASIIRYGLYNQNLQAVPPTGSISYLNNSTASIHPITTKVEIRKEGQLGRIYFPAPHMTNDNLEYFTDAFVLGPEKLIDTYAAAAQHVDQGLSMTLFFPEKATTRDLIKAQGRAWRSGCKTIYYERVRQEALEGTDIEGCVACAL